MEKMRKFGERLWYNKERIVLVIMISILCWHVYSVVNAPVEAGSATNFQYPSSNLEDIERAQIPPPPAPAIPTSWKGVYTPNPFWFYSGASTQTGISRDSQDPGIKLLRIQEMPDGKLRAQLQTTATNWYSEGAQFETFQLLKIDPGGSCQVYSEGLGKVIVLTVAGN